MKKGTYYNYHYNKKMLFCFKEILESSTIKLMPLFQVQAS